VLLALICFLAGAAIMVIEISAYRLLAPLFGNSAYTWTALIGVVLIAFSIGGYLGGWLAERKTDFALLGWLLAGASVLTSFVPAVSGVAAPMFAESGLIAGPLSVSLMMLALPGILLGAVSPVCVRLLSALGKDAHVGIAAGTISMLGSLGSFLGTCLSGFYLLSNFGVRSIFVGTGVALIMLAGLAFYLARNKLPAQLPIWLAGAVAALVGANAREVQAANAIFERDSYYHRIRVVEEGAGDFTRRYLQLDSTAEGGMKVKDGSVVMDYQRFWQLPTMKPDFEVKRALFLGAGAFGMPEQLSKRFPQAIIDVVEIDPQVIAVGHEFFKLSEFPNVHAHAGDARHFLRQQRDVRYDFIFGDAYNGVQAIPAHLCSREFFALVQSRLTPQGMFLMNLISALQGPKSKLLSGMMSTLGDVFPHLELFAPGGKGEHAANLMLLGSAERWTPHFTERTYVAGSEEAFLQRTHVPRMLWPVEGPIFTDDFNPVDAIIARGLSVQ
jgi:spermidine synthase